MLYLSMVSGFKKENCQKQKCNVKCILKTLINFYLIIVYVKSKGSRWKSCFETGFWSYLTKNIWNGSHDGVIPQ